MRGNHNSKGLHLVEEVVAKVFSACWSPRWNPWCILSCLSSVEERDEREKWHRWGMPKGGSIVQVQTNKCQKSQTQASR